MRDELRALQEPVPHELRVRRRGVALDVCAGSELEYIYRLAQLRNAITMELNAIPAGGNGGPDGGPAPPTATADDDLFSDGGEDDLGPHDGMAVWDDGSGPAGTFDGGIAGGLRPQEFEGRMGP